MQGADQFDDADNRCGGHAQLSHLVEHLDERRDRSAVRKRRLGYGNHQLGRSQEYQRDDNASRV